MRGSLAVKRLLIRPGAIGDCILCLPALEHLKTDYTEVWISSPVVPLIQFADSVRALSSTRLDSVFADEVPEELVIILRQFDEIVSWYGTNRPEFRSAILAVNPRTTFLEALPARNWSEHATDFFLHQVSTGTGAIPRIDVDAAESRGTVVIHPFSGGLRKNWPLDKFQKLAHRLPLPVEWTAGPEEALAGARRIDDLMQLARWIKGGALYIGNDSGISHLAAAIGMPSVVLFGPTDPAIWAPRGTNVTIIRHQPLSDLSVDQVLQAALSLL